MSSSSPGNPPASRIRSRIEFSDMASGWGTAGGGDVPGAPSLRGGSADAWWEGVSQDEAVIWCFLIGMRNDATVIPLYGILRVTAWHPESDALGAREKSP